MFELGFKFRNSLFMIFKGNQINIGDIGEVIEITNNEYKVCYNNGNNIEDTQILSKEELINSYNHFNINETLKELMDLYDLVIISKEDGVYTIKDFQTEDVYQWNTIKLCDWFIEDFKGKLQNHDHDDETVEDFKNVISELSMVKFLSTFNGTYDESEYAKDRDLTYVFRNIDNGYLSASLYCENDMYYMEVCKFINGDLVYQENIKHKDINVVVSLWKEFE